MTIGERVLVHLRLDVQPLHAGCLVQQIHLDLIVEVADITNNRLVLHALHVLQSQDVHISGASDVDVTQPQRVFHGGYLVAFHCRLQRVDRIDLGHNHTRAHAAQRLRRTLAHIAISADHRDFAGQHYIGSALDSIRQ